MKPYINNDPTFSESIELLETTDTNHADNFNVATKKLFENTMVLKKEVDEAATEAHQLVDDDTGQKYKMGIDNGLFYVETVETSNA